MTTLDLGILKFYRK